ncbi:MAG: NAD(P)H-dependent oxidoreductase subunit E [Candidatus Nanopelagicales bacterium]|nr:NAD(P)H-dependent oxidoreductase subunit E [Candidatus Nanopelagicales bacterium]MCF8537883.1 NAD(P)H-dependent oxidoreductase subunit E [Candidatus Nanopelagicales bacterium]MCF8542907.1 NAD(P)H-dependent oxidoreductase subunit E [Candidatus Nanopelagicales bacterium]MCF8555929.1 NAD(P)H-dependent oxidoreductase subunit E [Candidatus Nanopelagicales bacterium]
MTISEGTRDQLQELVARYPRPRSALMPMLHLMQSLEDEVTPEGISACAEMAGVSPAEATAVASFYTMYKRRPVGKHHIGVCVNTLCGLLGGDAVYEALSERLGVGHDQPTSDGDFWLERIECQAACTHAPVMTVDWEYMDDVTPSSAVDVIDRLQRGETVHSTRGPVIRGFRATEHTLAFPEDGLAAEGTPVDDKMLAGLRIAKERGMSAPAAGQEG